MAGKTILILGGGVGGIVTANALAKQLKPEHRVVVVDKNARHEFAPSFLWVMIGTREPDQVATDLRRLLHPRVEFVNAEIGEIDLDAQKVNAGEREIHFDYLVCALGASLAPENIFGLDSAHTSYTLAGATKLWETIRQFKGGRMAIVVARLPYKCPAAPYETALLLKSYLDSRSAPTQMDVYTPEPLPMSVAGSTLGNELKNVLELTGIAFHPFTQLKSVDSSKKELLFENASAPYDLLVAIPPHIGSRVAREAGLANDAGWIPVDGASLKTKFANVFAIGDAAAIALPGRWKPDVPLSLPKAGVFAHAQGQIVAANIAAEIQGQTPNAAFDGNGYCMVEVGNGAAAMGAGNFYATPNPAVRLEPPSALWHWGKALFEKYWLSTGIVREFYRALIIAGAKSKNVDAHL